MIWSIPPVRASAPAANLPPSFVLEAMHILEAEVNLREETRVAEQARPALAKAEFTKRAEQLSLTQPDSA